MFKKFRNSYHQASTRAHHHTIVVAMGLFLFAFAFAWQIFMPQGQASANFYQGWCLDNQVDITIPLSECQALEQLFMDTSMENAGFMQPRSSWATQWFSNTDPCSWYAIMCSYRNDEERVTHIDLVWQYLSGSPDFRSFPYLNSLLLQGNNFDMIYLADLPELYALSIGASTQYQDQPVSLDVPLVSLTQLQALTVEGAGDMLSSMHWGIFPNMTQLLVYSMPVSLAGLSMLTNLDTLYLQGNGLSTIDFTGMGQLRSLRLDRNILQDIDLSPLVSVKELSLADNLLTTLDLSALESLQDFSVNSNQINSIIRPSSKVQPYMSINLQNNNLTSFAIADISDVWDIPLNLLSLANNNILTMNLSGVYATQVNIGNNSLQSLDVSNMNVSEFYMNNMPVNINQILMQGRDTIQNIGTIYINNNDLVDFPTFLADISGPMYGVDMQLNYINRLPSATFIFPGLNQLNLGYNRINSLDNIATIFPDLQGLNIAYNRLVALPLEITTMHQLQLQPHQISYNCLDPDTMDPAVINYLDVMDFTYGFGTNHRQSSQDGCVIFAISINSQNAFLGNLSEDAGIWEGVLRINQGDQLSATIQYGSQGIGYRYHFLGLSQGQLFESYMGPTMAIALESGWYRISIDSQTLQYEVVYDPNYDDGSGGGDDGDGSSRIGKKASTAIAAIGSLFDYTVTVPYLAIQDNFDQGREPWYILRDYMPDGLAMLTGQITISGGNFSGYIDENRDLYGLRYGTAGDACYQEFVQDASGPYMDALDDFTQIVSPFQSIEELLAAFFAYTDDRDAVPAFMMDYCLSEFATDDVVQCYESFYALAGMPFLIQDYSDSCGEYGLLQEDFLQYRIEDKIYGVQGDVCYEQFMDDGTGIYADMLDGFVTAFVAGFPSQIVRDIQDIYNDLQDMAQYDTEPDLQDLIALLDDLIDAEGELLDDQSYVDSLLAAIQVVIDRRSMDPSLDRGVEMLEDLYGSIFFLINIDDIQAPAQLFVILAGYDESVPFQEWFAGDFCGDVFGGTDIGNCLEFLSFFAGINQRIARDYPACGLAVPAESPYREMLVPRSLVEGQSIIWNYTVHVTEDASVGDTVSNEAELRVFNIVSEFASTNVFIAQAPSTVQAELAQAIYIIASQDDINTARSELDMFIVGEQVRIDDGRGDDGSSGSALLVDIVPIDLGFEGISYVLVLEDSTLPTSFQTVNIIGEDSEIATTGGPYIVNSLDVGDEFAQIQFQGDDDPIPTAFGVVDDKEDMLYTISTYFGQIGLHQFLFALIEHPDGSVDISFENAAFVLSVQDPGDGGDDTDPTDPSNGGGTGGGGGGAGGGTGGGGGVGLETDVKNGICEIRDCSDSYYDRECGICDDEEEHAAAADEEQIQRQLLIDNNQLFLQTVQQVMAQASCAMTTELTEAYVFAYDVGITTVPDICLADMYGGLIRKHMAKFMVMFATEILGQSPDITRECLFADMGGETLEFRGFARMACQLGIMGVASDGTPVDTFNPDQPVTRAQFGTALSRVLYGSAHNTIDGLWYAGHLNALQQAGIMTQIENPNMLEVRGRVMLMLMRTYLLLP